MTRSIRHQRACALAAAAFALLGAAACGDSDGGGSPYGGDSTTGASQSESASPSETATAETAAALAVADDDDHGEFLVDGDGLTLYLFTPDSAGTPTCYDACERKWPPLLTDSADVTAGTGVDATLIGTIERKDGTTQVTYNKWPLYYYADDNEAGDTEGQGVQDVWFLVSPAGEANKTDS
jgi:predicted lipoprotein with Yx(FWY)xxD motif